MENVQDQFPFPVPQHEAALSDVSVDSTTSIKSDDSLLADDFASGSAVTKLPPSAPKIKPSSPTLVLSSSVPQRSRLHNKLHRLMMDMARGDYTIVGHADDKLFADTEVAYCECLTGLRVHLKPLDDTIEGASSSSAPSVVALNSGGEPIVAVAALIMFSNHFCARLLNSYIDSVVQFAEFDEEWSTRLRGFVGQDSGHLWMAENKCRSQEPTFFKVHQVIKRYMPFVMKLLKPFFGLCLNNPVTEKWSSKLANLITDFDNESLVNEKDFQEFLVMCTEYFSDFVDVSPAVYLRNALIYSAAILYRTHGLSAENLGALSRAPDFSISFCSLLSLVIAKDIGTTADYIYTNLQLMGESMRMALMKALLLIHDSRNTSKVDENLSILTWDMLSITLQYIVSDKDAIRALSVSCDEGFLVKIAGSPLATLTCLKVVLGDDARHQKPYYGNMFEWRFLLRIPCAFTIAFLLAFSDTLTILKVIEELLLDSMISFCSNLPNAYPLAVCTALGFLKELDEEWIYRSLNEYYGTEFCQRYPLNAFKLRNTWLMILNNSNGLYWIQQCLLKMKWNHDDHREAVKSIFSAEHLLASDAALKHFEGKNPVADLVAKVDHSSPGDFSNLREDWYALIKTIPIQTWIPIISSGLNTARSPRSLEAFVFPWLIELSDSDFKDMASLELAVALEAVFGTAIQYQLATSGSISSVLPVIQLLAKIAGDKCDHKELLPIISSSLFDHMKTIRAPTVCSTDQGFSYLLYYVLCFCMVKYCKTPARKTSLNPMANSAVGHTVFTLMTMAIQSNGDLAVYEFINWMYKRPVYTFRESPGRIVKCIFACLPTNVCIRFVFGYIETFVTNHQLLNYSAKEAYWIAAHYFCDYALFGHARNKGERIRYNEAIFVSRYQIRMVEIFFSNASYEQVIKMLDAIREYTETMPGKEIGFTPIKEFEIPIFASFEESHVFRCRWFYRAFFKEIVKKYIHHEELSNNVFLYVINKDSGWWDYLCWKETIIMEFVASAFASDALNPHNEWLLLQLLGNLTPPRQEAFMVQLKDKGASYIDNLKKGLWGRRW